MMRALFANRLHGLLALALLAVTAWGYWVLPFDLPVPVHWNISGVPDNFAPAWVALLLAPAIAISLTVLFRALEAWSTPEKQRARQHILAAVLPAMTGIAVVLQVVTISAGLGMNPDVGRIVALCLAVLFIVIGNVLPKSQRNWLAGIRVPPTLADDANWQATHRVGGWLFLIAGVLLAVYALVIENQIALFVGVMVAAILPVLASIAFSYWYWFRTRG